MDMIVYITNTKYKDDNTHKKTSQSDGGKTLALKTDQLNDL